MARSVLFMLARMRRTAQMSGASCGSSSKSSLRVPLVTGSMAGKMRRSARLRSSLSSMLPVPLNSSKMTSSIFEPVSTSADARMVRLPPPSMLRAAPRKRLGG